MDTQILMFAGWSCAAVGAIVAIHARLMLAAEREYASTLYQSRMVMRDALARIYDRRTEKAKGAERDMANIAMGALARESKALVK